MRKPRPSADESSTPYKRCSSPTRPSLLLWLLFLPRRSTTSLRELRPIRQQTSLLLAQSSSKCGHDRWVRISRGLWRSSLTPLALQDESWNSAEVKSEMEELFKLREEVMSLLEQAREQK